MIGGHYIVNGDRHDGLQVSWNSVRKIYSTKWHTICSYDITITQTHKMFFFVTFVVPKFYMYLVTLLERL